MPMPLKKLFPKAYTQMHNDHRHQFVFVTSFFSVYVFRCKHCGLTKSVLKRLFWGEPW